MAMVWLRKLSDVREVARELLRLVGAESDELRGGTTGRPTGRPREPLPVPVPIPIPVSVPAPVPVPVSRDRDRADAVSDIALVRRRVTSIESESLGCTGARWLDR